VVASQLKASVSTELSTRVTVILEGRLDEDAAELVSSLLDTAIDVDRGSVRLDLTGITFIDMSGLDTLLAANTKARVAGVPLELVAPWRVMDMLVLTGTDGLFQLATYESHPADDGPLPLAR
jgi:anti-anti-sigma factor